MNLQSRETIYAGTNFIVAPMQPALDRQSCLRFQELLDGAGISVANVRYSDRELIVVRETPFPLEIKVGIVGPQIGQIIIVTPILIGRSLDGFGAEAEDIVNVFSQAWNFPQRQILSCDATLRDLYDTTSEHAFKELWEQRLHQSQEGLNLLGRPVLGGGLRFVMPPTENEPLIEVKIESFLRNSRKLFLEAQFTWPSPQPPGNALDPENRLCLVDNYMQNELVRFIMEGQG
jgi:hypothetical protein